MARDKPRQVQLRWCVAGEERQAWVPVIDEFGRIAATILPRIDIEEAWSQLANFPMPPDDEELLADGDAELPTMPPNITQDRPRLPAIRYAK